MCVGLTTGHKWQMQYVQLLEGGALLDARTSAQHATEDTACVMRADGPRQPLSIAEWGWPAANATAVVAKPSSKYTALQNSIPAPTCKLQQSAALRNLRDMHREAHRPSVPHSAQASSACQHAPSLNKEQMRSALSKDAVLCRTCACEAYRVCTVPGRELSSPYPHSGLGMHNNSAPHTCLPVHKQRVQLTASAAACSPAAGNSMHYRPNSRPFKEHLTAVSRSKVAWLQQQNLHRPLAALYAGSAAGGVQL